MMAGRMDSLLAGRKVELRDAQMAALLADVKADSKVAWSVFLRVAVMAEMMAELRVVGLVLSWVEVLAVK